MAKDLKRVFEVGESVFVVDWWGTDNGNCFFGEEAEILSVNEEDQLIRTLLYGDTVQYYKFSDYNHIVFDTAQKACEVADKLPKCKDKVFLKTSRGFNKKTIKDLGGRTTSAGMELYFVLDNGMKINIDQIGKTLFLELP